MVDACTTVTVYRDVQLVSALQSVDYGDEGGGTWIKRYCRVKSLLSQCVLAENSGTTSYQTGPSNWTN